MEMKTFSGIGVSPGIAIGEAYVLDAEQHHITRRFIVEDEVEAEVARYDEAVRKTCAELDQIKQQSAGELGDAAPILDAHIAIIHYGITQGAHRRIRDNRFSAEYAVQRAIAEAVQRYRRVSDQYLAQRVGDIRDIERRLLSTLLGRRAVDFREYGRPVILIAVDLPPSLTAELDKVNLLAFATDLGGPTGHTAIVARARQIPAVLGVSGLAADVNTGDHLIIDGDRGQVLLNPDADTLESYRALGAERDRRREAALGESALPAVARDGLRVTVQANIEFSYEAAEAVRQGAEGIGLFRTEYLYGQYHTEPDEELQLAAYADAVASFPDQPVVIRTLDLGADKMFHLRGHGGDEDVPQERNPALGFRAVRYCLARNEVFRRQLRAICRASALGDVRLLVPMVCSREEIIDVRRRLEAVQEELAAAGIPFNPRMPLGIMVEVPSVAIALDHYNDVCDFYSIGTNDLTQYLLAVDRTNNAVANLYRPSHPAVLRLLRGVFAQANAANRPVSLCGEMGGEPGYVPLLLGLGLRSFSVSPPAVPTVKKMLRSLSWSRAEVLARRALTLTTARDVASCLRGFVRDSGLDANA